MERDQILVQRLEFFLKLIREQVAANDQASSVEQIDQGWLGLGGEPEQGVGLFLADDLVQDHDLAHLMLGLEIFTAEQRGQWSDQEEGGQVDDRGLVEAKGDINTKKDDEHERQQYGLNGLKEQAEAKEEKVEKEKDIGMNSARGEDQKQCQTGKNNSIQDQEQSWPLAGNQFGAEVKKNQQPDGLEIEAIQARISGPKIGKSNGKNEK